LVDGVEQENAATASALRGLESVESQSDQEYVGAFKLKRIKTFSRNQEETDQASFDDQQESKLTPEVATQTFMSKDAPSSPR